jgi:hypothetical protein
MLSTINFSPEYGFRITQLSEREFSEEENPITNPVKTDQTSREGLIKQIEQKRKEEKKFTYAF